MKLNRKDKFPQLIGKPDLFGASLRKHYSNDCIILSPISKERASLEQLTKAFAFVLMPFESAFNDIYHFGIKEPAKALSILAQRVDEQIYREGILERIYRQIEAADIVIADMSGRNANVFYEVGFAHAKDKLCILLTTNAEDIPFDLKHRRHIVYEGSIEILRTKLIDELKWALEEIQNVRDSHIKVTLKEAFGDLKKSRFRDEGEITLKIDLANESEETSPELEALYFYSTAGWTLSQDGKECPSTDSDRAGFEKRHFLGLPIRRLQKGGWAQVRIVAKKTLASVIKGEKQQDTYRISGRGIVRVVTAKGNFDYELPIDVELWDIPF